MSLKNLFRYYKDNKTPKIALMVMMKIGCNFLKRLDIKNRTINDKKGMSEKEEK